MSRARKASRITSILLFFTVIVLGTFIGMQYFTKTGFFKIPGIVYYEDSLTEAEKGKIAKALTDDVELEKDVHISAYNTLELPKLKNGEYLYSILVPVADFYSADTDVTAASTEELLSSNTELVSTDELSFENKLLSINGHYYLDEFDRGGVYRIIKFDSEDFDMEIAPLVDRLFSNDFMSKDTVLTFAQTGVTALSRGMNEKLSAVGDATYFSEKIKDFLAAFDITHTSNESSFSDFAYARNICSDNRFKDTLLSIGLDIVELTGNHNQDCGDQAAIDSIDFYKENNISIVGGGKTAAEASKPVEIDKKGNNITLLAYNLSTGGATLDDTPGANQYYEEDAVEKINAAKKKGDTVIIDIQYYECNAYASEYEDPTCDYADSAAGDQVGFFRHLIDLGADVVVGTSAHQPQTFELYGGGAIYYGLGNLFFDQIWWPGTTRSLVLAHYFHDNKLVQTKVIPTIYDNNMQTRLLEADKANEFLQRLIKARP